ncbi:hypothetical protein [Defluviitalea saccharophila]|uniref:Uncharacterized protein n=1 Tax=Defluviitalea saccharophila TaxID=879970 RepID=A0ABZ2Y2L6_9FIRM
MYSDINEELKKAHEGMLYHQKLVSKLEDLRVQKSALVKKVEELRKRVEKEDLDVENLEGKSISHIFHTILGNLDKKLEKEREEALAVRLKYNQACMDLRNVEDNIARLELEEVKNRDWETIYQRVYNEKKENLIRSGAKAGEEILNLSQQITALRSYGKELKEAIEAGEDVLTHLEAASKSLNSAEGWGTWDLIGGGFITDMAKHSRIDEAKVEVSKAQTKLSHFRSELADIKVISNLSIEISDFEKFADFFFDGLFADWHMQSKIKESLESVERAKNQVNHILIKLKSMEKENTDRINSLDEEINNLITKA